MADSTVTHSQSIQTLDSQPTSALVRQFRQLLGLTQEQFAARMGVTLPTINRWENDRARPSPLALLRIKTLLTELVHSNQTGYHGGAQALLVRYFAPEAEEP